MRNHFQNLARCCLLFFLFFFGQQLLAQNTITGTVSDGEQKEPLIGGTVLIKGKTTGTITDINGKYSINATDKDVLVFTFIGMEKQEIPVLDKKVINVILQPNSNQLDEVVAIGYGTVKKSDRTGSIAVVSAKELTRNPSSSAMQALQGKAPGVLVFQNGAPGGGATIRVRGVGSISKGSDPLYILDGVPVSSIAGIQPQEIENMQVLKDASAAAIYGANGSNGVVIVNTKRGNSGKIQVNLNTYVGINLAPKQYDMMNADQYSAFYKAIYGDKPEYNQAFREKYYGKGWQEGTNWQDLSFKNGYNQNYNLSLAGGSENSNFNVALSYANEDGTVIKTSSERYSLRANSDFKLGKHVKFGENAYLSYSIAESPMTVQSSVYDLNVSPLMKVYNSNYVGGFESCKTPYWIDDAGNLLQGANPDPKKDTYYNTVGNDKPNPIAAPSLGNSKKYNSTMRASVYMQIDFTNWLMFKVTPSAEINNSRSKAWLPLFTGNRTPGGATLKEEYSENITLNLENQLTFNKKFNDVHNVQATIVNQIKKVTGNNITGAATGFDFESLNTLSNGNSKTTDGGTSDYRMLSYLGRVMYDYKGKYFATGSIRSDGISVFGPAYKRGNFAASSVAWKVNEDFFKDIKDLDMLKLRLGWGQTGNSGNIGSFEYYDQLSGTNMFSPVFGADQHIAAARYAFYQIGYPDIHWEASEMYNLGLDLNMFNNKLQASAEYYIKNTNNLLVKIPVPIATGKVGRAWCNFGDIQNRGIELSLQWRDRIGEFGYGISSNFSTTKNEVLNLPVTDITDGNNRTIVGHSIGALYGFVSDGIIQLDESNYTKGADGQFQKDGTGSYTGYKHSKQGGNIPQPGDIRFSDLNEDGDVTPLDKTIIGKTIPSFNYSFGFDCSYKNFDFNIFLYGIADFDIYNQQRASISSMNSQDSEHNKLVAFAENHWTLENASTTYVRVDPSNVNENDRISTFWIEDGSFLRVKDVQLGYTLPKRTCTRLGVATLRMYVNASNLYCFTAYKGRDPEGFISSNPLNGGTDSGGYTMPKSFTFGLQIGF
jgi:TonB-dependent starch-binding outer membrane protein SusC